MPFNLCKGKGAACRSMSKNDFETNNAQIAASQIANGKEVRRPCCRRRGGGGAALVEPAALAALLYADGYGYDMRKTILEKTDGQVDIDAGGLYRSLRRLEEEKAVVSRWCDEDSGPRRREYELTPHGVELAGQWLAVLRDRQRLDGLLAELLEGGFRETDRNADVPEKSNRNSGVSKEEGTNERNH